MMTLMVHPTKIEVSLLINVEIPVMRMVHQRKSLKKMIEEIKIEMIEETERDQLRRKTKKPSQKSKQNSLKSSNSKRISQHLTTT